MAIPKEYERYTWRDYQSWSDDERWELFNGMAWAMSPAPNRSHQKLLIELGRQFANFLLGAECQVFVAPFDVKLSEESADEDDPTVFQPDLVLCCDPSKLKDWGMQGAPDLVVEILSPKTGVRDRKVKFDLYERYRVGEYWILDPDGQVLEIYRHNGSRYERVGAFSGEDTVPVSMLPGFTVEMALLFPKPQNT
jgi:Uma2 family endonuclease